MIAWAQTAGGIAFDLLNPAHTMVQFERDIAGPLARIARFSGHVEGGAYSVAQHCVMGADAMLAETKRPEMALAFLLHDAHEALIGDITSPVKAALKARVAETASAFGLSAPAANGLFNAALKGLEDPILAAIFKAAGAQWPMSPDIASGVKTMDMLCLATERQHLLGPAPRDWGATVEAARPLRLVGKLRIKPWPEAADDYMTRLRLWAPRFATQAA